MLLRQALLPGPTSTTLPEAVAAAPAGTAGTATNPNPKSSKKTASLWKQAGSKITQMSSRITEINCLQTQVKMVPKDLSLNCICMCIHVCNTESRSSYACTEDDRRDEEWLYFGA